MARNGRSVVHGEPSDFYQYDIPDAGDDKTDKAAASNGSQIALRPTEWISARFQPIALKDTEPNPRRGAPGTSVPIGSVWRKGRAQKRRGMGGQ